MFNKDVTSVFATVGNILILFVILKYRRLQIPSNLLLGSLSVTDFLVGLMVQPVYIIYSALETESRHICNTLRLLYLRSAFLCLGVTVLNITLISIDRCFPVLFPFRYEVLADNRKYCWLIITTWVAWALFNLLSIQSIFPPKSLPRAFYDGTILVSIISAVIIIISYCLIYRVVRRLCRQTLSVETAGKQDRRQKQRKHQKMAKTFAITIGVFLLCWTPWIITKLIDEASANIPSSAYSWCETFLMINSSLNPLIYCYRLTEIREAILDTFWRKIQSRERNLQNL